MQNEGGLTMTQLSAANAKERPQATSAISLAAITAGAVAAAVVIMSIGSIVTIISIGSSINTGMQTATAMLDDSHTTVIAANSYPADRSHFQQVKKSIKRSEKSFYIDAVLREDSHHLPTPTSEQVIQQPKLTIKGNHVFA
jgi:alpha/beta superfamily hydrolase